MAKRHLALTDRKSTRLNSSHTEFYTLTLHVALPIWLWVASELSSPSPISVYSRDQAWVGTTPSPQRNVSTSSAPATTEALSSQGEMPFRSNMNEGWRKGISP